MGNDPPLPEPAGDEWDLTRGELNAVIDILELLRSFTPVARGRILDQVQQLLSQMRQRRPG